MNIRINTLTLHNFKGCIGEKTFDFEGKNACIVGDNGTGKSTVFDAFTWLLFGKDHKGQDWTTFNIKPIDPVTREQVPDLDAYWVEAQLDVQGVVRTIRRVVTEDWVKPTGKEDKVLRGNTQTFFIDGVAMPTKKAYDLAIKEWIDEDIFRIVTNPLYFIGEQTIWQDRRTALLEAIGVDFDAPARSFPEIAAAMAGRPLEQFRRETAAAKAAQRAELTTANANVDAWKAALPEEPDADAINAQIAAIDKDFTAKVEALREREASLEKSIGDINAANAEVDGKITEKQREAGHLRLSLDDIIRDYQAEAREKNSAHRQEISRAEVEVAAAEEELRARQASHRRLTSILAEQQEARGEEASRLTALATKYESVKKDFFNFSPEVATSCPTCGRPFAEDEIAGKMESLKADWVASHRAQQKEIQDKARVIREEVGKWDESIASTKLAIDNALGEVEEAKERLEALDRALADLKAHEEIDLTALEREARKSEKYLAALQRIDDLQDEIDRLAERRVSPADLTAERRFVSSEIHKIRDEHEAALRPLRDALAVSGERDRMLGMIAEEKKRAKTLAAEVARLERLELQTKQFIKATIDAFEGPLNSNFKVARWNMFNRTLDGGIVETCEVTTTAGVPFRSMNDAARILCGIDVINFISTVYGMTAPIFIDNAESVTVDRFDTPAQVIRLVVKKGAKIRVTTENE